MGSESKSFYNSYMYDEGYALIHIHVFIFFLTSLSPQLRLVTAYTIHTCQAPATPHSTHLCGSRPSFSAYNPSVGVSSKQLTAYKSSSPVNQKCLFYRVCVYNRRETSTQSVANRSPETKERLEILNKPEGKSTTWRSVSTTPRYDARRWFTPSKHLP